MKKIINNFLYIIIVLFPIIDLISSFNIRYNLKLYSPGIIIRGLFFLYIIIYTLCSKKINKDLKKKVIIYYTISIIFFIIFIVLKIKSNISLYNFLNELKMLFKFWYFPITLIFLKNYDYNAKKLFHSLNINTLIYALCIIIPLITNTYFNSYSSIYKGIVGWFYSANEIGSMLSINLLLLYLNFKNKKNILLIILNIFSLTLIGTKVSLFSLIIITISMFLLFTKKYKVKSKESIISFAIGLISLVFILFNNTSYDIFKRVSLNQTAFKNYDDNYISILLSNRDNTLINKYNDFKNKNLLIKTFGMGFINNNECKSIEMDIFDILFSYGYIGFIIYFIPLIYYLSKIKKSFTIDKLICIFGILLSLSISFICGHTLSAPSVSIYISIFISLLSKNIKVNT